MKPAYLVADMEILDPKAYEEYRNRVAAVIAEYGGKYLVRGGPAEVLEGDRSLHRIIIVEFSSLDQLNAFYRSTDYGVLKELRKLTCNSHIFSVEGV
jgi:uncharacterized protein (DUF1330 family)